MLQRLEDIILFSSAWVILVPAIIGVALYRNFSPAYRVLSIHLFVACFIEILSYIMQIHNIPNLPLLHFYTLSEFTLLFLFYERSFAGFYPKTPLRILALAFLVFSLLNSVFIQKVFTFNSYARTLEAFLFIILSLLCFYKLAQDPSGDRPLLWINTGILLYFSGAFTLFVLSNYILPLGASLNFHIWTFHSLLSLILYTLISIGLWTTTKT